MIEDVTGPCADSEPRKRRILILGSPSLVGDSRKRKTWEDDDADFIEGSTTVKLPVKRIRMSWSARTAAQLDKGILGLAVELLLSSSSYFILFGTQSQHHFPDMLWIAAARSIKSVTSMHNLLFIAPRPIFYHYLADCSHREQNPVFRFKAQYLRTEVCWFRLRWIMSCKYRYRMFLHHAEAPCSLQYHSLRFSAAMWQDSKDWNIDEAAHHLGSWYSFLWSLQ